ncbi:MAG: hypothetical protein WCA20_07940 [Candidatus Sulfotelmatobacter sp.]
MGQSLTDREGAYYIEWYEKGTRRRQSFGKNAIEAHNEQQRHIQLLRNEALGMEVVRAKEDPGMTTIADSCAAFLEEVRQLSWQKTYQQYSVALRYFQECCRDKQLREVSRSDLLKFLAFLREEKGLTNHQSNRLDEAQRGGAVAQGQRSDEPSKTK